LPTVLLDYYLNSYFVQALNLFLITSEERTMTNDELEPKLVP